MTTKKKAGPPDQGLGEDAQLVRGPKELFDAMREIAARDGQKVVETWRRAAQAYVDADRKKR